MKKLFFSTPKSLPIVIGGDLETPPSGDRGVNRNILLFTALLSTAPVWVSAQCDGPKYGQDSIQCVNNLSNYVEYVKQKNYSDAYLPWKWAFENCPRASKKAIVDGIKILEFLIKNEKNPARKELLIDTLLIIYDKRIQCFSEEGLVLGKKGVDLYLYRKNKAADANSILQKSVELQGNKSEAGVLVALIQTAAEMVKAGTMNKEKLFELYDRASTIIDFNIVNNPEDKTFYESAKTNIDAIISPFAECKDLIAIYEPKVKQNKQDTVLLRKVTKMLYNKNCTSSPLFAEASEALYQLEPTAFAAFNLGKLFQDKGQHGKATGYLQQAVDLEGEGSKKGEYLYELAVHYFRNLSQYEQARNIARRAASYSGWAGRGNMLMGDIYVSSGKSCFSDDFEVLTVYWPAIDKYMAAKNADPSLAEEANKKIATYSQYFPKRSDAFFRSLQPDQDYTVGCWINEVTKVRVQ